MKTNIFKEYILPWEKPHSFNKSINTVLAPGLCAESKIMSKEDIILANQESYSLLNKASRDYSSDIPGAKGKGDREVHSRGTYLVYQCQRFCRKYNILSSDLKYT